MLFENLESSEKFKLAEVCQYWLKLTEKQQNVKIKESEKLNDFVGTFRNFKFVVV